MFDIHIAENTIDISSVEREDIVVIQKWINNQNANYRDKEKELDLKEFYERFLEYYVSEGEFFLKINKDKKLIGVLKGRLEFKNPTEVWFWYFLLDNDLREKGIGSKIINRVMNYFSDGFGITSFYTGVCEKDTRIIKFWKKNCFNTIRISKGFFDINGREMDMIVMRNDI